MSTVSERIETTLWEPDPTSERGYLRLVRTKTIREVYDEICALTFTKDPDHGFEIGPDGADEYFVIATNGMDESMAWPTGGFLACFAVVGSSEGDYVHVERLIGDKRIPLFLGKTFQGNEAAWQFAIRLARMIDDG